MPDMLEAAPAANAAPDELSVRAVLERRAAELARVPDSLSSAEFTEFVVFRVGGETYAVAASSVSSVFKLCEMAVVPGAPVFVRGLTLFKGQVLPVLDLRVLIGASAGALSDLARVVAIGGELAEFGLLADSIEGIRRVTPDQTLPAPRQSDTDRTPFVSGMTRDAVLLLDADALVRLFHGGGS